jgi:hypothetical protein
MAEALANGSMKTRVDHLPPRLNNTIVTRGLHAAFIIPHSPLTRFRFIGARGIVRRD